MAVKGLAIITGFASFKSSMKLFFSSFRLIFNETESDYSLRLQGFEISRIKNYE